MTNHVRPTLRRISSVGATLVAVAGATVLVGWIFDLASFKSIFAGFATMKVNTASAFLSSGVALLVLDNSRARNRAASRVLAIITAAIGALTLVEYALDVNLRIDQALIEDPDGFLMYPGRPAIATAIALLFAGTGIGVLTIRRGRVHYSQWCALIVIAIGWLAITGYVYGVSELYRVGAYSTMAVHTAILLVLLGLSILIAEPSDGFLEILTSDTSAGVLMRRLAPAIPVAFFLLGWLWLTGQRAGLFNPSFGAALMMLSATALVALMVARQATLGHRAELARRVAETHAFALESAHAEKKFEALLESAPDGIVIVNHLGRITIVNAQTERLFGYCRQELLGEPVEILLPERFRADHQTHRSAFIGDAKVRPMGSTRDLWGRRKDGSEFAVEVSLSPLDTPQGLLISSTIRDVTARRETETARRRAEDEVRASLAEKETLLGEIHHRVKNNLAVISSLFYLEASQATTSEGARLLQEARDRVLSMAMVHETLYKSSTFSRLQIRDYLDALLHHLIGAYTTERAKIAVHTSIEPIALSIDDALPCGLIVNELVTNCLKHAFPGELTGEIFIRFDQRGSRCLLSVSDTGVGVPDRVNPATATTLGLRLVRTLTAQLDGEFEIRRARRGTEATLSFPCSKVSAP